jgi:hypothetical protein
MGGYLSAAKVLGLASPLNLFEETTCNRVLSLDNIHLHKTIEEEETGLTMEKGGLNEWRLCA